MEMTSTKLPSCSPFDQDIGGISGYNLSDLIYNYQEPIMIQAAAAEEAERKEHHSRLSLMLLSKYVLLNLAFPSCQTLQCPVALLGDEQPRDGCRRRSGTEVTQNRYYFSRNCINFGKHLKSAPF